MARKDLDKETERPRYYSQFWLDIAAGRRVISADKGIQESEETEALEAEQTPEAGPRGVKGVKGASPASMLEGESAAPEQSLPPLKRGSAASLEELAAAAGLVDIDANEEEVPGLESEEVIEERAPLSSAKREAIHEAEPEEESYGYADLYEEDDEQEEEEEEEDWPPSRRGKKHAPNKKQDKPRRRERGRDF